MKNPGCAQGCKLGTGHLGGCKVPDDSPIGPKDPPIRYDHIWNPRDAIERVRGILAIVIHKGIEAGMSWPNLPWPWCNAELRLRVLLSDVSNFDTREKLCAVLEPLLVWMETHGAVERKFPRARVVKLTTATMYGRMGRLPRHAKVNTQVRKLLVKPR